MAARPSQAATLRFLAEANEVAKAAVLEGNHPFGAVLVDPQAGDGEGEVLLRQGNIDTANHAESTLAREAFAKYPLDRLQRCTLYTTFEPCAVPAPTSDPCWLLGGWGLRAHRVRASPDVRRDDLLGRDRGPGLRRRRGEAQGPDR